MARNSRLSKSRSSKPRPPSKMGRKWTQDDVLAYNIKVVYEDVETFFGVTDLPPSNVENDEAVAIAANYWGSSMLIHNDSLAEPDSRFSSTIGFVRALFDLNRYTNVVQLRSVIWCYKLRFLASQGRPPQVDICVIDGAKAILMVINVDRHVRGSNPEPRLISHAIGAFHNSNIMRTKCLGTNPLATKVMPGIVMDGTMPTFYKIPVTPELVRAIESGSRPEHETIVHAYRPEVPRPKEGMRPFDNRNIILSCFEAFRQFL